MLRRSLLIIFLFSLLIGLLAIGTSIAWALPAAPPAQQKTPDPKLSLSDEYCLSCHGQPGQPPLTLGNGETLDLYVPAELHQNSVHGQLGYACVQCHRDVGEYPHPPFQAADRRDVTLRLNEVTCRYCHYQVYEATMDGVHASIRANGNSAAATCSDCHTAHEIRRLNDPETGELLPDARQWIPERCALCHNDIYAKYEESVHGAALTEGNPDVPTCIDCHGVHNIADPRTSQFRLYSPLVCARCHADEELMSKYGISTDVFESYVADFHGTTVAIFEQQSPYAEANTAVCYDCHGVHDIGKTDDPHVGLQMQENLLESCQQCHPDATSDFTSAWLSHYTPSPDVYPLVYYVELFYKIMVPGVLGFMIVMVVLDFGRMALNRVRRRRRAPAQAEATETPQAPADRAALLSLSEEIATPDPVSDENSAPGSSLEDPPAQDQVSTEDSDPTSDSEAQHG